MIAKTTLAALYYYYYYVWAKLTYKFAVTKSKQRSFYLHKVNKDHM